MQKFNAIPLDHYRYAFRNNETLFRQLQVTGATLEMDDRMMIMTKTLQLA